MYKILKNVIKKILQFLGYEIVKYYPEMEQKNYDEIYKQIFKNDEVLLFDVGANKGQSIDRFEKILKNRIIHSFEPINFEFEKMKKKYSKLSNIKINNFAIGDKIEEKTFFINNYTGSSSFLEIKKNTEWTKLRSKQFKIDPKEFIKEEKKIKIETIDNYCQNNHINEIDILKIDTQGYEDKVLLGASKMLQGKKIKLIEFEIILSDIYSKTLSIGEIENILGKNYRLFANDNRGNLYSNFIYQLNLIYIEKEFLSKIKIN